MKKICFISTVGGTLKAFVLDFAKYLYKTEEFEIYFICAPDKELLDQLPEYIHLIPLSMKRGINLEAIHIISQMVKIFRENRFDIIQYSTPNASFYASVAGWLTGIPVRLYCQWGIVYVGFKGIKKKIFKVLEKIVCRLSTWIEPDSKSNLKFCHEEMLYSSKKSSVVWNGSACGVNLSKFDINRKMEYRMSVRNEHNIPSDAFVFGFLGRITKDKGINELLSASKRIIDEFSNAYLLLIGNKDDDSVNKELLDWAIHNEKVIMPGYTLKPEKYISGMDCFVLPSYREGFGLSVVEAESMGVPVIVTNIPGPIDGMIEYETGLIVPKKDVVSLYEAMKKMIINPDLTEKYGLAAHEYATKHFDQSIMMEKLYMDRIELIEKAGERK